MKRLGREIANEIIVTRLHVIWTTDHADEYAKILEKLENQEYEVIQK